ncbi:uncharacterized protein LTHEOB_5873 [Lasiodiplodia theobromae]|uniref:Uncharacterized protein n=1 Tax=Lasiodiplodia theobromae TaxID=45133 RepID=A0A5N5DKD3_9PEZI|nr:uncharacterized protein LTHEOB_5873 [Lasiodiplodia theobromae]KAB2578368.1 hypothetical protein DBV05_g2956 [Lasiodiplodia theobromae]KAF4544864.1 hypothetical protein LTHEOB_5873 [Lasiodiplodia theobromae]
MSRCRSGSPSLPSLSTYTTPSDSHHGAREESAELEEGGLLPSHAQQGSTHESPQAVVPTGTQDTASSPSTGTHISIENGDSQEEWWSGLDNAAIKKRWLELGMPKCRVCGKQHQPPHSEELLEKARVGHEARTAKNLAARQQKEQRKQNQPVCDRCGKQHAPPCHAVHCTQCGQMHLAFRPCPSSAAPAPVPSPAPSSMLSDDSIETLLKAVSGVSREAARAITRRWLDLNLANTSDVPAPAPPPVPLSPGELSIDGFARAMIFAPNNDIARAVARRWSELNSANANDGALVPAPAPAPTSASARALPSPDSIRAMLAAVQAASGDQALATAIARQWARDLPSQPVASNNPPTRGHGGNRGGRSERSSRGGSGSRGRGGRSDMSMRDRSRSPQADNADRSRRERSPASRRNRGGRVHGRGHGHGRGNGRGGSGSGAANTGN